MTVSDLSFPGISSTPAIRQAFAENPWFGSLPRAEAEALLRVATPRRLGRGEHLLCQGTEVDTGPGGAFFGLGSGLLKLSTLHADGRESILALVEPGNWVGEVAILTGAPRLHTVLAVEDCIVLAVSASNFEALMQRSGFASAITRLLAARLYLAYDVMDSAAQSHTQARIARRLTALAHGDVTQSPSERHQLIISQDMLAMMLGLSRPTLNKGLQALADTGAVALHYGRIEIIDMTRLRTICEIPAGNSTGKS